MSDRLTFGRYTVELSSQDRLYFPDAGITKGELVDYYRRVAETMLPTLRDRPLTLHRFPEGIDDPGFFQQSVSDHFPDWIARVTVDKEDGEVTHPVCQNAATLVYLANQGTITFHAWLSRQDRLHHPDRMIIDLDPEHEDFGRVRQAALQLRDFLSELGLISYTMTTGSKGFHVVVPLDRSQDFEMVRDFARDVAEVMAARHPDQLTTEQRKAKRGERIYLDTLRNSYAHTGVAPYSVRAKPGAPVATPVEWAALEHGDLHPQAYNVRNVFDYLEQHGDPWQGMARHARSLKDARQRLDALQR